MDSEVPLESEALQMRTYSLLHWNRWRLWLCGAFVVYVVAGSTGDLMRLTEWSAKTVIGVVLFPAGLIGAFLFTWRCPRRHTVTLESESFQVTGEERIAYACVTEVREYAALLEVRHESISVPLRWNLKRTQLRQEDWEPFTTELKRRVRRVNPAVRIYDAESGPPPSFRK